MMQPLNHQERKKGMLKFVLLYALSIVLLAAIYYFGFYSNREHESLADTYTVTATGSETAAGSEQIKQPVLAMNDMLLLNNYTQALSSLDSLYNQKLFNASPTDLQVINDSISRKEFEFKTAIAMVKGKTAAYPKNESELMLNVLDIYNRILKIRQTIKTERQAMIISQASATPDDKAGMKLRNDLSKKDVIIAQLETDIDLLKTKQSATEAAGANNNALKQDSESMQAELKKQKEITNNLSLLNDKLKEENTQLKNDGARNTASTETASRVASLQSKIDELSADLNFAQVECNLKRVDANQIISNSRQRREILTQSLQSLSNLSKSANPVVQNKAKIKMKELTAIAQNLRD